MDVVWLKRDVRLQDHGPLAAVSRSKNPLLILYLYEPDQLADPTVHGSHIHFVHEGLIDLECRISQNPESQSFDCLTVSHSTIIDTLEFLYENYNLKRLLAHQETGHWQSFMRDKAVRKWCRSKKVPFIEFNQTGVTRCLRERDDYLKKFKAFINRTQHPTPDVVNIRSRLVTPKDLPNRILNMQSAPLPLFTEIPQEHREDRPNRQQKGGTTKGTATLESFLKERGSKFSQGISSPNTSWNSCSRLSPYLTWGHISLRQAIQALISRQEDLRRMKQEGRNIGTWLKSLQAFSSRLHWRSHFIQKLESEPIMEKKDLCQAYQSLRRQEGDWNEEHYQAWKSGKTGFPFVDACMRCLIQHGWLNFRMRAMLVSFATYNLWLDWKKLAPHLARVFLDYEPGIHYPQLQMQAGTTGINAMRVYNVTKQGKDQDAQGIFIRRFVKELTNVPNQYIHEPWKMPLGVQQQCKVFIGPSDPCKTDFNFYPEPIVNEQESARTAKAKLAAVRNRSETKKLANQVYKKHGSRNNRRDEMNGKKPKALSNVVDREDPSKQRTIKSMFSSTNTKTSAMNSEGKADNKRKVSPEVEIVVDEPPANSILHHLTTTSAATAAKRQKPSSQMKTSKSWNCNACTFLNEKPLGLVCAMCNTPRKS